MRGRSVLCALGVLLVAGVGPALAQPGSLAGEWSGVLAAGPQNLPLILNLPAEGSAATLTAPSQSPAPLAGVMTVAGSHLTVSIAVPAITIELERSADDASLSGTLHQSGASLPLTLKRGLAAVERPQTPTAPFP